MGMEVCPKSHLGSIKGWAWVGLGGIYMFFTTCPAVNGFENRDPQLA
jgi:hypothetical protein